jgi:exopolysaccharide production protein ExoZ
VRTLASVQGLRAVAALGVLAFHACQWSGYDFAVGAAGVDIFFFISGFVLWSSVERAGPSPAAFLGARLVRVAPLYWLASLAYAAVAWRWPAVLPEVYAQPEHLLLSLAFLPHTDPAGGPFPLLPSGWTLTYEAFFYLAMALALAAPAAKRFRVVAGVLTVTVLLGFAYHGWYTLLANPLLLEFVVGAALARAWRAGRTPAGWPVGVAATGAGLLALTLEQILVVRSDFWRPVLFGAPAFAVVVGVLALEAPLRRSGAWARGLVRLGDASYALYLSHLMVVSAVWFLTPGWPPWARIVLTLAVALPVGLGCWAVIERPITRALRQGLAPSHPVIAEAGA